MRVVVIGDKELHGDSNSEVIVVQVSYLFRNKRGQITKLVPTKLSDVKVGDLLAYKVSRDKLIVKRSNYMFVGQEVYRFKRVIEVHKDKTDIKLDTKTNSKYITINKFLFKGDSDGNISVKPRIHRDRKQKRKRKTRKPVDLSNNRIWRQRRNTKTV